MSSLFAFQPSVHRWVKIDDLSQLPLQVERENVLAWTQCPRYLSIGIPILEVNRYFHSGLGCFEIIYDERVFPDGHGACTPKLGNNHFHRAVVELVFRAVELHSRFDLGLTAASTTSSQEQDSDKQSTEQKTTPPSLHNSQLLSKFASCFRYPQPRFQTLRYAGWHRLGRRWAVPFGCRWPPQQPSRCRPG